MRNVTARYNLNNPKTLGPRQCLIVGLLAETGPLFATEIAHTFSSKASKPSVASVRTSAKRLIRLGLVRRDLRKSRRTADGFFHGERFSLTAKGRRLAARLERVTGLGRNFAVVLGYR